MSNLPFSSHCQAHSDCICFSAARQRYLGVDTLKELFENVESRNIVAFIKDTNFYHCMYYCFYYERYSLGLTKFLSFLLTHKSNAFNHSWH